MLDLWSIRFSFHTLIVKFTLFLIKNKYKKKQYNLTCTILQNIQIESHTKILSSILSVKIAGAYFTVFPKSPLQCSCTCYDVDLFNLTTRLIDNDKSCTCFVIFVFFIYVLQRFTQYLASNNCTLNLSNFIDKTGVQGVLCLRGVMFQFLSMTLAVRGL